MCAAIRCLGVWVQFLALLSALLAVSLFSSAIAACPRLQVIAGTAQKTGEGVVCFCGLICIVACWGLALWLCWQYTCCFWQWQHGHDCMGHTGGGGSEPYHPPSQCSAGRCSCPGSDLTAAACPNPFAHTETICCILHRNWGVPQCSVHNVTIILLLPPLLLLPLLFLSSC